MHHVAAEGVCLVSDSEVTGYPPAWDGITQGYEMSPSANLGATTNFIRACLKSCDARHPLCKPTKSYMPTRLVDVGGARSSQVRIVETDRMGASPYVALSYCWGPTNNFRTTKSTLRTMAAGVPVSNLPQTVQDAVQVTRELNLRYLWVDAICIIQDSKSDWEMESSNMASVYQHAYLTIAAGTANNSSQGFLNHQHQEGFHRQSLRMDWRTDHGQRSVLAARIVPGLETHVHSVDGDREQVLPLNVRGWTLQEELLSTRMITYTQQELWWTCQTTESCECHTFDITENNYKPQFSPSAMTNSQAAFGQWRDIVNEFSQRRLSHGTDKLPALSGIATVIQEKTGSSYVAGLWESNLIMDLNWYSPERTLEKLDAFNAKAKDVYYAPTFSWASADGMMDFFRGSFVGPHQSPLVSALWVPKATLINAETVVDGENALGRVKAGHATLRGHVVESVLEVVSTNTSTFKSYFVKHDGSLMKIHADMRMEEFRFGAKGDPAGFRVSVRRSPPGSKIQPAKSGSPIFLFHLGDWNSVDGLVAERAYLVLGRSPRDTTKYERLGLAHKQIRPNSGKAHGIHNGSNETVTIL